MQHISANRPQHRRWPLPGLLATVGILTLLVCFVLQAHASAASSTINFQARLLNAAGSIVPDGTYNVEFKLYNAATSSGSSQGSCTGDANCLWVETYTGANAVRVTDGYLTVSLGSLDAFPSTINWDQSLYLGMNIGGTGTPSWDGEMSPRLAVTATPYAQSAQSLSSYNATSGFNSTLSFATATANNAITIPNASGTICLQGSSGCGFATGSGTAFLQGGNSFGSPAVLGTLDSNVLNLETAGNTVASFGTNGSLTLKNAANSTTAFQVQNASASPVLTVDTTNNVVTVGSSASVGTGGVEISGSGQDIGTTYGAAGGLGIFGEATGSSTGPNIYLGGSARGDYQKDQIQLNVSGTTYLLVDGNATGHTLGNVGIGTNAPSSILSVVNTSVAQPTAIFNQDQTGQNVLVAQSSGTNVLTIGGTGAAAFENSSNSTTAFQVQGSSGTSELDVDTTNNRVGIGIVAPLTKLQVGEFNSTGPSLSFGNDGTANGYGISAYNNNLDFWSPQGFNFDQGGSTVFTTNGSSGAATFQEFLQFDYGLPTTEQRWLGLTSRRHHRHDRRHCRGIDDRWLRAQHHGIGQCLQWYLRRRSTCLHQFRLCSGQWLGQLHSELDQPSNERQLRHPGYGKHRDRRPQS